MKNCIFSEPISQFCILIICSGLNLRIFLWHLTGFFSGQLLRTKKCEGTQECSIHSLHYYAVLESVKQFNILESALILYGVLPTVRLKD